MELKIETKITKSESSSITNNLEIINYLTGNDFTSNNFEVIDIKTIDFTLSSTRLLSPINIFNLLQINKEDCSFLHIQCLNSDTTLLTNNINFTVNFGGQIFKCSQLTLANIFNFNSDIIITDIEIPDDNKGILTIVVGIKEEEESI
jgi:hypothetical protein